MKTRSIKVIRDVLARKGRTALVAIAIFIGVAGTIALFSMSDIIVGQLEEDIKPEELPMASFSVTGDLDTELDTERYITQIAGVDTVTTVSTVSEVEAYFSKDPNAVAFSDMEQVFFSGYADDQAGFENIEIEPMRLVEGAFPADNTQVAVEQRTAEEYDLSVGDTVYFRILGAGTDVEPFSEARSISGLVFHPYSFAPTQNFYGLKSDANYIAGTVGVSEFRVRFESYPAADDDEGMDAFEDRVDAIEDILAASTYSLQFTETEDPENNGLVTAAETITGLMGTLALISLVVSGFLVINVITSIVTEQRNQIGVMKALGATRKDAFFIYSGIAFAYGLIGVIPGVLVGIPGGYLAADFLAPEVNTLVDGFQISVPSIFLGVIVGLAVPVLASILPVFNGTRVSILEAMTDLGIDANYGKGPLAKGIAALPVPTTVRQGLASVSIKKVRLLFTVITLTIAVGAFMGIYGLFDSIRDGIGSYLDSFNTEVGIAPIGSYSPEEFGAELAAQFGTEELAAQYGVDTPENGFIRELEPGFSLGVDFLLENGEKYEMSSGAGGPPMIFAYGLDVSEDNTEGAFLFSLDEGERWETGLNDETGIILTGSLARGLDVGVGDRVTMSIPGATRDFDVIGISEYPIDQVYVNWRVLAEMLGNTYIPPEERVVTPNEYFSPVMVEGYEGGIPGGLTAALGIDSQFATLLEFLAGQLFTLTENEVVVTEAFSQNSGYGVGDSITITGTEEGAGSNEYVIAGIFEIPANIAQGLGEGQQMIPNDLILFYWRDLASLNGLDIPEGELFPQFYFANTNLGEDASGQDIEDKIDIMREEFLETGRQTFYFNFVDLTEQFTSGLLTIQIILSAVALLIAIVGALGLLTTLSMSVYERQKEIGVMRSIGARSRTIAAQFLTEGMVVGLIAWLIGLPVAVLIQVILLEVTGFSDTFPLSFPVQAAAIGLVGTVLVTTIASLWPSLSAANRTVSDILRYQ